MLLRAQSCYFPAPITLWHSRAMRDNCMSGFWPPLFLSVCLSLSLFLYQSLSLSPFPSLPYSQIPWCFKSPNLQSSFQLWGPLHLSGKDCLCLFHHSGPWPEMSPKIFLEVPKCACPSCPSARAPESERPTGVKRA